MILWTLVFQTATADVKPPPTRWTVPVHRELIIQVSKRIRSMCSLFHPEKQTGPFPLPEC